jgi:hypothetical protein
MHYSSSCIVRLSQSCPYKQTDVQLKGSMRIFFDHSFLIQFVDYIHTAGKYVCSLSFSPVDVCTPVSLSFCTWSFVLCFLPLGSSSAFLARSVCISHHFLFTHSSLWTFYF